MKRTMPALAICALLFSCADLTTIEDEGCGNRVINVDEDCDTVSPYEDGSVCGSPNSVNACFFECDPANNISCPQRDGWTCGTDGRCRRPSGNFALQLGTSISFVEDFVIGDADGDSVPDLMGTDGINLSVRFNDGAGGFSEGFSQQIPRPTGEVTFTNFDDDELLDALVPLAVGFFSLNGTDSRTLEPYNYAPFPVASMPGQMPDEVRVVAMQAQPECNVDIPDFGVITFDDPGREHLLIVDTLMTFAELRDPMHSETVPDSQTAGSLAGNPPTVDLDGDGVTEVALGFEGGEFVYFYTATGSAYEDCDGQPLVPVAYDAGAGLNQVALDSGYRVHERGIRFIDMDNDGDLDLIVAARTNEFDAEERTNHVLWSPNDGTGRFAPTAVRVPFFCDRFAGFSLEEDEEVCHEVPWPLAAGYFDDDDQLDYVFNDQLVLSKFAIPPNTPTMPGPPPPLQIPTELQFEEVGFAVGEIKWDEAVVLDINNDGHLDVAASSSQERGIDIFINAGNPTLPGYFNPFRLQTELPVRNLQVGDFDGDLMQDVAFLQGERGFGRDRLAVVFGSGSSGPSGIVDMGEVGAVSSMDQTSFVQGPSGLDLIDDLMYVARPFTPEPPDEMEDEMEDGMNNFGGGGPGPMQPPASLALMFGDSSRTMLSPYLLEVSNPEAFPVVALAGQFANVNTESENPRDVVLVYTREDYVPDDELERDEDPVYGFLIMLVGVGGDGDLQVQQDYVAGLPKLNDFNTTCARWVVGDPDGDGNSVIIGVDNGPKCGEDESEPSVNRLLAIPDLSGLAGGMPMPTQGGLLNVDNPSEIEYVLEELPVDPTSSQEVRRVQLVDMDGDDDLDLLVVLGGRDTDGAVIVVWNNGRCDDGKPFCQAQSRIIQSSDDPDNPLGAILDATRMQADADDEPELMIITEDRLWFLQLDLETENYVDRRSRPYGEESEDELDGAIHTADVNGDGLIDIVANTQDRLRVLLHQEHKTLGLELLENPDFLERDDDDDDEMEEDNE